MIYSWKRHLLAARIFFGTSVFPHPVSRPFFDVLDGDSLHATEREPRYQVPICWGGCPKKHLEDDDHAIAEQGVYWRNNLARLVATKTGYDLLGDGIIDESLQFRGVRHMSVANLSGVEQNS